MAEGLSRSCAAGDADAIGTPDAEPRSSKAQKLRQNWDGGER